MDKLQFSRNAVLEQQVKQVLSKDEKLLWYAQDHQFQRTFLEVRRYSIFLIASYILCFFFVCFFAVLVFGITPQQIFLPYLLFVMIWLPLSLIFQGLSQFGAIIALTDKRIILVLPGRYTLWRELSYVKEVDAKLKPDGTGTLHFKYSGGALGYGVPILNQEMQVKIPWDILFVGIKDAKHVQEFALGQIGPAVESAAN